MWLDQLTTLQPCVFCLCCNTRRCNFRYWNLGRETAPWYNNKATQNSTVLDVRPSAYPTTPTDRSARAWDTTRADKYLSFYSVLRKTVKWSKKSGTVSAKLCSLQWIFCVQDTKHKKVQYKNFPHEVGRSWISEVQNQSESNSDELQLPEKQTTTSVPKQDPPDRLSGDFRIHKLEKILGDGEGKRKYPVRQCEVCAAHKKRSETRCICKFCVVPLHTGSCFEKYHSVTNY